MHGVLFVVYACVFIIEIYSKLVTLRAEKNYYQFWILYLKYSALKFYLSGGKKLLHLPIAKKSVKRILNV